jgi:hypothetical protein
MKHSFMTEIGNSNAATSLALEEADSFAAIGAASLDAQLNPEVLALDSAHKSSRADNAFLRLREHTITLAAAEAMSGLSRTTFWRFRKRHRIRLLTGRRICAADIISGFEAERRGTRRAA